MMTPDHLRVLVAHVLDGVDHPSGGSVGLMSDGRLLLGFRDAGAGEPAGAILTPMQAHALISILTMALEHGMEMTLQGVRTVQ